MAYTPVGEISTIVNDARSSFDQRITQDVEYRKQQLRQLKKCLIDNEKKFADALIQDLGMSKILRLSEIDTTLKEISIALANLDDWTKPEPKSVPLLQFPGKGYVYREPYGVALIVAPFNYPLTMITRPLVGAIAAGNCVIMKPSEMAVATQNLLSELFPKYLDKRCYKVITGAVPETTELLKQKFDYILYTGNGMVGKLVLHAAAENFTPVTLELGGKSPCIIGPDADIKSVAPRVAFGKWTNCGQTCVAPDYVFVPKELESSFTEEIKKTITLFYGANPKESSDYGKIINPRHVKRIAALIPGGKVVLGGEVDEAKQYIAPTVLTQVDLSSPLMKEEIFGPLMPVLTYNNIDEVIKFINDRPKPLALYAFTNDKKLQEKIVTSTSFGGGCINDTLFHNTCPELPFGGVGASGMGAYNGKYSFELFTHQKAVLKKPLKKDPSIKYPPYTDNKIAWLKRLNNLALPNVKVAYVVVFVAVALALWQRNTLIEKFL